MLHLISIGYFAVILSVGAVALFATLQSELATIRAALGLDLPASTLQPLPRRADASARRVTRVRTRGPVRTSAGLRAAA